MSKTLNKEEYIHYLADTYMHDMCGMQQEMDMMMQDIKDKDRQIDDLKAQIKDNKEIRRMLDAELARSNRILDDFRREYKV